MTSAPPGGDDFGLLADSYRKELLAHCYRMLGSVDEAEDQVQETLLRAWRSYGEFEGRSSMRTWLYRIATNSCLRALETRARRPLPSGLGAPADDASAPLSGPALDVPWLQPMPDAMIAGSAADPASVVASRTGIRLAMIAALQYLPGRQRAVLILRDVLGWHAAEVADLLGTSEAAANSALQRARARMASLAPAEEDIGEPDEPGLRDILERYATAWETADVAALTELLRRDAVMEMPPQLTWFAGRSVIGEFLARIVLPRPGQFRMLPVAANGQPGFAAYAREDGRYQAHAIQVLTAGAGRISRIVSFNDAALFPAFGLPADYSVALREQAQRQ
jgi:RNA polymerase sigma-70 factor (ECF subfamily)